MSKLKKLLISIAIAVPALFLGCIVVGVIATIILGTSMVDGYETINGGARSGAVIVGGGIAIGALTGWFVYKFLTEKEEKTSIKKR